MSMYVSVDPVPQMLDVKQEGLHDGSSRLDQQPPEPPHIKEEEEEHWTNQDEEQSDEQKETDVSGFPFTVVTVKNEGYEEKSQLLELHQIKTEGSGETEAPSSSSAEEMKAEPSREDSGGGPEPERKLHPECTFEQNLDEKASDSSETEVSDDDNDADWQGPLSDSESETKISHNGGKEGRAPHSGVNSDEKCNSVTAGDEGEKLFVCGKCDKRFKKRDSLTDHVRVHTGEKPFGCDVCEKRFRRKDCLRKHKMTHSGKMAHSCDFCGKGFIEKTDLQAHIRLHTGERPFACDECGRRFHKKSILTVHTRVHSGEKQFNCAVCGKRFRFQHILKKHSHGIKF
uniref:C2H2-type domain-containing protein n=1 Tax=Fundulus heteroclitus TaxID=8078 RepID=A0A3Q2QQZ8_FUNHE